MDRAEASLGGRLAPAATDTAIPSVGGGQGAAVLRHEGGEEVAGKHSTPAVPQIARESVAEHRRNDGNAAPRPPPAPAASDPVSSRGQSPMAAVIAGGAEQSRQRSAARDPGGGAAPHHGLGGGSPGSAAGDGEGDEGGDPQAGVFRTPWGCLLWAVGRYDPHMYPMIDGEMTEEVRGQRRAGQGNAEGYLHVEERTDGKTGRVGYRGYYKVPNTTDRSLDKPISKSVSLYECACDVDREAVRRRVQALLTLRQGGRAEAPGILVLGMGDQVGVPVVINFPQNLELYVAEIQKEVASGQLAPLTFRQVRKKQNLAALEAQNTRMLQHHSPDRHAALAEGGRAAGRGRRVPVEHRFQDDRAARAGLRRGAAGAAALRMPPPEAAVRELKMPKPGDGPSKKYLHVCPSITLPGWWATTWTAREGKPVRQAFTTVSEEGAGFAADVYIVREALTDDETGELLPLNFPEELQGPLEGLRARGVRLGEHNERALQGPEGVQECRMRRWRRLLTTYDAAVARGPGDLPLEESEAAASTARPDSIVDERINELRGYEYLLKWTGMELHPEQWHPHAAIASRHPGLLRTWEARKVHASNVLLHRDILGRRAHIFGDPRPVYHVEMDSEDESDLDIAPPSSRRRAAAPENEPVELNGRTMEGVRVAEGGFEAEMKDKYEKTNQVIGVFTTAEEAARAYDTYKMAMIGTRTATNFYYDEVQGAAQSRNKDASQLHPWYRQACLVAAGKEKSPKSATELLKEALEAARQRNWRPGPGVPNGGAPQGGGGGDGGARAAAPMQPYEALTAAVLGASERNAKRPAEGVQEDLERAKRSALHGTLPVDAGTEGAQDARLGDTRPAAW
ncbi:unnamed protein product [Pedinophyceae sp. YPF-701]|nr:unnamed protein product [Pedinophyceae sp. YPF-701]